MLALAGAALLLPAGLPAADKGTGARTIGWNELMPKDWDPVRQIREQSRDKDFGSIKEGSARELELMDKLREIWDSAPTRSDLDGARIRLPGYVVPLEQSGGEVREFLLVPYFGACIHSPPPPANQIVHVVLAKPRAMRTMDTVWVTGTMKTRRQDSPMGISGYSMERPVVEPYRAPPR